MPEKPVFCICQLKGSFENGVLHGPVILKDGNCETIATVMKGVVQGIVVTYGVNSLKFDQNKKIKIHANEKVKCSNTYESNGRV